LEKTRCTRARLPAARVPAARTREIQISKFPPGSHQINTRTRRPANPLEKKQQK
jgi:hypothetical protein